MRRIKALDRWLRRRPNRSGRKAQKTRATAMHRGRVSMPDNEPGQTVRRKASDRLRIMTYNVHHCRGLDRVVAPERIARVVAAYEPDIVALQELDVGRPRTGGVDQAHLIAQSLEMQFHFHPAIRVEEEQYGDAILTHLPMRLVRAAHLCGDPRRPRLEPRGALWAAIDIGDGVELQVINTHLGLRRDERNAQVTELLDAGWIKHPECIGPLVMCGDLNAVSSSLVCRRLGARLRDVQLEMNGQRPKNTWLSLYPSRRIDHIFVGANIDVLGVDVPRTRLARLASDHLPVVADIIISTCTVGGRN